MCVWHVREIIINIMYCKMRKIYVVSLQRFSDHINVDLMSDSLSKVLYYVWYYMSFEHKKSRNWDNYRTWPFWNDTLKNGHGLLISFQNDERYDHQSKLKWILCICLHSQIDELDLVNASNKIPTWYIQCAKYASH